MHCATLIGAAALIVSNVNAHGWLGLPAVTFRDGVDKTQFIATIEASTSGLSGSYSGSPAENTAAFTTAISSSKYSSLKDLATSLGQIVATGANIECGLTDPNESPQPLPDHLEWTHSDTEGFTSSHEGPCEAWCDDTQVFKDDNCAAHFTTAPAKMTYDKSGCVGASRLTFYWVALHSPTWQVYANCAALEGGSGSSTPSSNSTSSGQSDTPTVTTATPTSATATPTVTTATPVATTTPTATTATPTSSGSVAGEADEDCGSFDVAGSDEEDCGSFDVAGIDEEDCDSLSVAGSNAENAHVSESSLSFDNIDSSYKSGKVQPQPQYL